MHFLWTANGIVNLHILSFSSFQLLVFYIKKHIPGIYKKTYGKIIIPIYILSVTISTYMTGSKDLIAIILMITIFYGLVIRKQISKLVNSLKVDRKTLSMISVSTILFAIVLNNTSGSDFLRIDRIFSGEYGRFILYEHAISEILKGNMGYSHTNFVESLPRIGLQNLSAGSTHNAWLDVILMDGLIPALFGRLALLTTITILLIKNGEHSVGHKLIGLSVFSIALLQEFLSEINFAGYGFKSYGFLFFLFFYMGIARTVRSYEKAS